MFIKTAIARIRPKTPRQILHAIARRVWPVSLLVRAYYSWRWTDRTHRALNRKAIEAFAQDSNPWDAEQERCLGNLRTHGITIGSLEDLTCDRQLRSRLQAEAERLILAPDVQRQIENRCASRTAKWYVIRALGYGHRGTLPEAMAEFFLHPRILGVVNSYRGMYSRLCYANLWYNLPVAPHEPAISSERWHRDHEDRNVVKLYLYLDDIDSETGPFTYLRGSQPGGPYAKIFPATPPSGCYPPEDQLLSSVPGEAIVSCVGPAGTVVLCDTVGFHFGGRTSSKPRMVLTATYVSDAAAERGDYRLQQPEQFQRLGSSALYALCRE